MQEEAMRAAVTPADIDRCWAAASVHLPALAMDCCRIRPAGVTAVDSDNSSPRLPIRRTEPRGEDEYRTRP